MRRVLTSLKRIVAVLVIFCLMFSLIPASAFAVAASDISGHWAQVTIQSWMDKGLIKGYPDGTFKPDQHVTRAEFMTLANRAFGYTAVVPITYSDVKAGSWYAPEVAKAKAAGYISGYPDGTMKPENPITREEVATIVARIKNLTSDANAASKYTDAAKIGSWSKGQVGAVTSAKIMQGYPDGSFMPQGLMTRAEVVVASDNALHYTAPLIGTSNVAINAIGDATVVVGEIATKTVTTTPADATVTAVSGTTAVAVVSITGHNITVTGVSAGTSKITVTGSKSGYGNGTATWTVTVIPVPVVSGGSAPAPTTYTVTFDSQGGTPTPDPITGIAYGATVTLPTAPTYAGHTFTGWFTAATDGAAFTATTAVTASITVYAQWTAPAPTTYAVTFTVADAMYAIVGANITIASHTLSTDVYGVATINLGNGTYPYDVTATGYDATSGSAVVNGAAVAVPVTMTATAAPVQLTIADPTLTLSKVADETTTAAVTAGALAGVAGDDDVTISAAATYDTAAVGTGKTITVVYTLGGADAAKYVAPVNYTVATGEITGAPYATVPSAIHLAIGSTAPVGGITDVAIPAAGATDTTGAVTGWVTATHDKIKFTVTDAGGATSTITINAGVYTSEADYTITATSALTIVVTTTEAGKTPAVRTFTVTVEPTICGHDTEFGGFTSKVTIPGTSKSGYAIYNAAQLQHMAMHPTENAVLMNDIVFDPGAIGTTDTAMGVLSAAAIKYGFTSGHDISQFTSGNFVPIGFFKSHTTGFYPNEITVIDVNAPYTGIFDGNGHTISGLNIDGAGVNYVNSVGYVGLFGYTSGAEIKNLIIKDATVKGLKYVGGVAGYMNGGSITNVSTTGSGLISGNVDQGGIVGFATGSAISNVSNNLATQGDNVGGGIAGEIIRSTLSHARNTGRIKAPCAGGLVGYSQYSTVEFSYNTGTIGGSISQEGYRPVGGLVGENDYSTVSNSYNTGSVTGSWQWIGGVVGKSTGDNTTKSQIVNVYNTGAVNGHDWVGGIVGEIDFYNQINHVYNTGAVTGTATVYGTIDYIGGIVGGFGYGDNSLNNSYNTGMVSGGGGANTGSVAGFVRGTGFNNVVSACYWLTGTYTKGIGNNYGTTISFESSDSVTMKIINDAISAITAAAKTTPTLNAMVANATLATGAGNYFVASAAGADNTKTILTFTYDTVDGTLEYVIVAQGAASTTGTWADAPATTVATAELAATATGDLYVRIKAVTDVSNASAEQKALDALTVGAAPIVGQSYGGGKVAYILVDGDPGYVAGQVHGLIAATADQSTGTGIIWAIAAQQSTAVTGTLLTLGSGLANTNLIVTQNSAGSTYAAGLARAYTGGGYTDWYLPSRDELAKLYANRVAIGSFDTVAGRYWSSSEASVNQAWDQSFYFNGGGFSGKDLDRLVRAVRSF